MYSYTYIEPPRPSISAFFCWLDGSDFSVSWTLWLKICCVENAEDLGGNVSEVDVALLTCNCSDIIYFFLNGIP